MYGNIHANTNSHIFIVTEIRPLAGKRGIVIGHLFQPNFITQMLEILPLQFYRVCNRVIFESISPGWCISRSLHWVSGNRFVGCVVWGVFVWWDLLFEDCLTHGCCGGIIFGCGVVCWYHMICSLILQCIVGVRLTDIWHSSSKMHKRIPCFNGWDDPYHLL